MNATIVNENNRLIVSGELNFETIVALWKQSLPFIAKHAEIEIDLSKVTASNSGGLALLLEWLKLAKCEKKTIRFSNVPEQLRSIARVAGVGSLL